MVTFASDDRDFVCAIALRIVRDPADAEDVAQDALLRAYRYRTSFRGDSRYRSWLYRIATTTALGLLRRRKRAGLEPIERVDDAGGCCRARHLRRERRDPHVSRVETAAR
jgi:RNA polymerase sigma factor (sigma-70 family)